MLKSLLIVLVTGATAATSKQSKNPLRPGNVNRLCVWVEQGGTPDTAWDLKAVKAYTATHKVCIVAKNGKNGKNGKAGAKGAKGAQGAQGLMGTAGAQGLQGIAGLAGKDGINGEAGAPGEQGLPGENGLDGLNGEDGENGLNGTNGEDGENGENGQNGQSVTSAVEPPGANCAAGGSEFTAANGVTYACNGEDGEDGQDGTNGTNGEDGENGAPGEPGPAGPPGFSGIVTVAGGEDTGDKQFTVPCPLNLSTPNNLTDRLVALSGGFDIQGGVKASFRSNEAGLPTTGQQQVGNSWTVIQTSGQDLSGTIYVYCLAPAPAAS
jgi:hypothetical protein